MSCVSSALSSDSATMRLIFGTKTLDSAVDRDTKTFRTWTATAKTATTVALVRAPRTMLGTLWFTRSHTWLANSQPLNMTRDLNSGPSNRPNSNLIPSEPTA